MKPLLDPLYRACGWLAGAFMVALLACILLSILGRQFNFYIRGIDAYAGYSMAASSFLALAYTFGRGEHIRVTLILKRFHGAARRALEVWCLGFGGLISGAFAFYSIKMAWWSYKFNDISTSNDATPLWIPQLGMAIGTAVLFLAFLDELILVLRGKPVHDGDGELSRTE